jgi:hypothetical protein
VAPIVSHQHGFDGLPVAQAQQELAGQAIAAVRFIHHLRGVEKIGFVLSDGTFEPALQRRREARFVCQVEFASVMQRPPQRLGMVCRHAGGG